jgi:hypothetical protein
MRTVLAGVSLSLLLASAFLAAAQSTPSSGGYSVSITDRTCYQSMGTCTVTVQHYWVDSRGVWWYRGSSTYTVPMETESEKVEP